MRIYASDIDDGNNSVVYYSLSPKHSRDDGFFTINRNSGIIKLNKSIMKHKEKPVNYKFHMTACAANPDEQKNATIDVVITVVDSQKKRPEFTNFPEKPIRVPENTPQGSDIVRISAKSNSKNSPVFKLGRSDKFIIKATDPNNAVIQLASTLDYETKESYSVVVTVENDFSLKIDKNLTIIVVDVNDHLPVFVASDVHGSVAENEPAGTSVMRISVLDGDRSEEFRRVTLSIDPTGQGKDLFTIEQDTHTSGIIRTKVPLDREMEDRYVISVIATQDGKVQHQQYYIDVTDVNDNKPAFKKHIYKERIKENTNTNSEVTVVKATDEDSDAIIKYSLTSGNIGEAFMINEDTGRITVNKFLDYETIPEYNLTVTADDGKHKDTARVEIVIDNVNDISPEFESFNKNILLQEKKNYTECILKIRAHDQDSPNDTITYTIENGKDIVDIETIKNDAYAEGCVRLKKALHSDVGTGGKAMWTFEIMANDNGYPPLSSKPVTVTINLTNINDNVPILKVKNEQ